jgi:aminoglycoside phosphotransferase (APT) family kinase protein
MMKPVDTLINKISKYLPLWTKDQYPDAENISFNNLRNPAQGYSNETWLIDLSWTKAGVPEVLPLVLRMQQNQASAYRDYDLSIQYRCMQFLQGSKISVPKVFGYEASSQLFGTPFYLMERVDGLVPNENPLYHVEGWLHGLSLDERSKLWFEGLHCCAKLTQVNWSEGELDFLKRPEFGQTALAQIVGYFGDHMIWAESLNRPYPHLHRAYDWLLAHQPQGEPEVLCWGDAKLGNCVYQDGVLVSALDWEGAHFGSPLMDVAWWITIDRCLSEGYGIPRLEGLPNTEVSLKYWENISGFSAENFYYYEVFSAFKLASIMARIGTIYTQTGKVPAEYEMDINNGAAAILAKLAKQHHF